MVERPEAATIRQALTTGGLRGTRGWLDAVDALDSLLGELDRAEKERDELNAEADSLREQLYTDEAMREGRKRAEAERDEVLRLAKAVTEAYTAEAEDWNDGEFALWKKDDLVNAIVELRSGLSAMERA